MRKRTLAGLLAALSCWGSGFVDCRAQAIDKARADLDLAVKDLERTRSEQTDLRRALYRDINRLDDEALVLGRELRTLEREEEQRTGKARTLERELEARKVEMDYVTGILKQYSQALSTRLHPAENQRYLSEIDTANRRAEASSENLTGELSERLRSVEIGLRRIEEMAGGARFEGKVLRNGSETLEGNLIVAGPSVFFGSKDGKFEGVASFAQTGTGLPTVVSIGGVEAGATAAATASGKGELPFDASMGKALQIQAATDSLWETIEKGGIVGHCILLLGAVALGIVIFKVVEIARFPVPSRRLINEILDHLVSHRTAEARQLAAGLRGLAGDLVRSGVEHFHSKRRVMEEALFEKLVAVKPRLDRFLPFLGLTAAAGPLMGLLGTVLGIIKTFKAMAIYGTGNAKNFSDGISEALITTAEGLIVAIPVLVLHGLIKSFAKGKFGEVEGIAISLMNGTTEIGGPATEGADGDSGGFDVQPART